MWSIVKNNDIDAFFKQYPLLDEYRNEIILYKNDTHCILPKYFYKNYPSKYITATRCHMDPVTIDMTMNATMREEQQKIISGIMPMVAKEGALNGIVKAKTGIGKALTLDSKILVPFGWKTMGQMHTGDKVIGRDGKEYTVTGVFPQGKRPTYRVTFEDGRFVDADEDHIWSIFNKETSNLVECTTIDIVNNIDKMEYRIPLMKYSNVIDTTVYYTIPPYDFGKIIKYFNKLSIYHMTEYEFRNHLHKMFVNEDIDDYFNFLSDCKFFSDSTINIHIPAIYFEGSYIQKKSLIDSLYITDLKNNKYVFVENDYNYAKDIQYLARSVGYTSRLYDTNKESSVCMDVQHIHCKYVVTINTTAESLKVVSVTYLGDRYTQCISVDSPDHLYVTNDFIVTHNTVLSLKIASILKYKTLILVDSDTLMKQWIREIIKFTDYTEDDIGIIKQQYFITDKPIVIGMLQTIMSRFKKSPSEIFEKIKLAGFGFAVFDEVHKTSASEKYAKISAVLPIPNIIGLSATPYKFNIQDILMKNTIGEIIYNSVAIKLKPIVNFVYYESNLKNIQKRLSHIFDLNARRQVYNKNIVSSDNYLNIILKFAKEDLANNHKIMIVCFTQGQVQAISNYLTEHDIENSMFYGKSRVYDGSKRVQVVTYSFAGTGFDDKELSCLYYATPLSGKVSLIQTAGRILRECEGKQQPIIRDFIDMTFPSLYMNEISRKKEIFSEEYGCEFNDIKVDL